MLNRSSARRLDEYASCRWYGLDDGQLDSFDRTDLFDTLVERNVGGHQDLVR